MKILITSHYFFPENFPVINDFAKTLNNQGHEVIIGTGKPNYGSGNIYKGYSFFGNDDDLFLNRIKIFRFPTIPRKQNKISLMLNYLSHIFFGSIILPIKLRNEKIDMIFHYQAGPITSVIPSIILKFQKKLHLVLWVQDLWPDTLRSFPIVNNSYFLFLLGYLVKIIYSLSDSILIQSKAFHPLMKKYLQKKETLYFPNSLIDKKYENKISINSNLKNLNHILNKFNCFIFAGNIGEAQSLNTILKAAQLLKNENNCKIIFIGEGSKSLFLKKKIEELGLHNVIVNGPLPVEIINEIFTLSSGLIVTLKNHKNFNYTIPSKVQSYLSAGKPILAALNGEGARVIRESKAGLVCEAEDYISLSKNIKKILYMDSKERELLGFNGKQYFKKNFEMYNNTLEIMKVLLRKIEEQNK